MSKHFIDIALYCNQTWDLHPYHSHLLAEHPQHLRSLTHCSTKSEFVSSKTYIMSISVKRQTHKRHIKPMKQTASTTEIIHLWEATPSNPFHSQHTAFRCMVRTSLEILE